eukprot:3815529-Prorocentrum_lima.AAC.1
MTSSLVGSEMCIRDRSRPVNAAQVAKAANTVITLDHQPSSDGQGEVDVFVRLARPPANTDRSEA